MKRIAVASALIASGFLLACGGSAPSSSGTTSTPAASAPKEGGAAATSSTGDFGVPECDEYIKKYVACIDSKVPEAARAQVRAALDANKAAWKQAASTPAGKAALAQGCSQASQMAATSMKAYGCSW